MGSVIHLKVLTEGGELLSQMHLSFDYGDEEQTVVVVLDAIADDISESLDHFLTVNDMLEYEIAKGRSDA